jgi:hypothetical protein
MRCRQFKLQNCNCKQNQARGGPSTLRLFYSVSTNVIHLPRLHCDIRPHLLVSLQACLFVMVSPDANNLSETVSTLQFGSNAQQVQLGQAKKNVIKGPAPPDDY